MTVSVFDFEKVIKIYLDLLQKNPTKDKEDLDNLVKIDRIAENNNVKIKYGDWDLDMEAIREEHDSNYWREIEKSYEAKYGRLELDKLKRLAVIKSAYIANLDRMGKALSLDIRISECEGTGLPVKEYRYFMGAYGVTDPKDLVGKLIWVINENNYIRLIKPAII